MTQMPTVWRLKTKPKVSDDARAQFIQAMLEEDFIATGWELPDEPTSIKSCLELLKKTYPGRGSATPQRFVKDTRIGDLVWIVDTKKGVFHLAQTVSYTHLTLPTTPYV